MRTVNPYARGGSAWWRIALSWLLLGVLGLSSTAALALTATTTTLTTSVNPSKVGQSVTLTATLSPTAATGTVTFKDGTTTLGTGTLSAGKATLTYAFPSAGTHNLTASFPANAAYAASTSAIKAQTVNLNTTTTALASGTNPSTVGQSTTLTATITPSAATGSVTFKDGTTTLGSATISAGKATFAASFSTASTRSLSASFVANASYAASTSAALSQTVKAQTATTTSLASSVNPSTLAQSTTLTATVTPSTATGTVTFKDGTTTLGTGTLSAGKATLATSFGASGTHSLTAVYAGDTADATSTSAAFTQTVNSVLSPSTTSLASSAGTVAAAQSFTLTASVTPSSATGTVTFKDGANTLGTGTVSAGTASLGTRLLIAGSHSLTAVYGGDGATATSTSVAIPETVTPAVTDTALSATPAIVASGSAVTLTAMVTGAAPTGSVTFKDGTTSLGSVPVTPGTGATGVASLSQVLAAGVHQLSASYAGDANNQASTSNTASVDVSTGAVSTTPGPMTWQYGYDPEGNRWIDINPLGKQTTRVFDSLNRPIQIANPGSSGQPGPTLIDQAYDGQDRLTQVVDPRNLVTNYGLDGLGNLQTLASPDTGSASQTVDAAGNVLTRTDSRGQLTTYTYDALNRMTSASYSGSLGSGTATLYEWDGGANPAPFSKGRLTRITDESGSSVYTYDALGRVLTKTQNVTQTVNGSAVTKTFVLTYTWGDANAPAGSQGSLTSVTYPSGNRVNYTYDTAGRLSALSLNPVNANGVGTSATTQALLSAISYNGANEVTGWTWGNGTVYVRGFDNLGRLASYPLGNPNGAGTAAGLLRTLGYDDAGRISSYTHTQAGLAKPSFDQSFGYDDLGQLTSSQQNTTSYGYAYDASGNRTMRVVGATSYPQTIAPTSNRLTQSQDLSGVVTLNYDNAGNLLNDRSASYTYSTRGRMSRATVAGSAVNYVYNGLEQRVGKAGTLVPTGAAYYAYDEAGQLIGEYDATQAPIYETVYLGSTPVVALKQTGTAASSSLQTTAYNVWSDHINTPRVITRASDDVIVWRWDTAEAFGVIAPDQNPSALGTFTFNQRFPGQLLDPETNNFYNWHRDYNASLGRYTQSDPIGLAGGINTYAYVGGNPLSRIDPKGLQDYNPFPNLVPPGTVMPDGSPAYPPAECPANDCPDPITITFTTNNVCAAGDSACASAMKAAGLQGPYTPQTTTGTYSMSCIAKLGIGVKGSAAAAGTVAGRYLPGAAANGLGRVGLPVAGAYAGAAGTTIAEISSGPIGISVSVAGAVAYLAKECKCSGK